MTKERLTTERLTEIRRHLSRTPPSVTHEAIDRELIAEIERLQRVEAKWNDCVQHRRQAEARARRYQQTLQGIVDLLVANDVAGYPP